MTRRVPPHLSSQLVLTPATLTLKLSWMNMEVSNWSRHWRNLGRVIMVIGLVEMMLIDLVRIMVIGLVGMMLIDLVRIMVIGLGGTMVTY